jgi:hypothetical protein
MSPNRKNINVFLTMPPDERDRLATYANAINRPMSWVIRDALGVYFAAVKKHPDPMARVTKETYIPPAELDNVKPPQLPRAGRPPKPPRAAA